ncbi:NUDIX hydrolase [Candidatus Saccharibacteria bacterium]|nr:NUDIX hydrolase [Candidatus Saccharibacteria bacterium]
MRTITPKNSRLLPKEAQLVFKGQIFDVYQWEQEMFDGSKETFEMLKRPDTIKVIAIKDNKIVITEEEQPNHRAYYDIPGGRHDDESETELEAAKRELLEETGLSFKNWRLIKVEQPYAKIEWFVYLFLATDFESQVDQKLDSGEKIEVKFLSLEEAKKLVNDPKNRYLPKDILDQVSSIENLINFPEYQN